MAKPFAINTFFGGALKATMNVMILAQKLFVISMKQFTTLVTTRAIMKSVIGSLKPALARFATLAAAALHGLMITQPKTAQTTVTTAVAMNYNTAIIPATAIAITKLLQELLAVTAALTVIATHNPTH